MQRHFPSAEDLIIFLFNIEVSLSLAGRSLGDHKRHDRNSTRGIIRKSHVAHFKCAVSSITRLDEIPTIGQLGVISICSFDRSNSREIAIPMRREEGAPQGSHPRIAIRPRDCICVLHTRAAVRGCGNPEENLPLGVESSPRETRNGRIDRPGET
jgi:hypothetical protein